MRNVDQFEWMAGEKTGEARVQGSLYTEIRIVSGDILTYKIIPRLYQLFNYLFLFNIVLAHNTTVRSHVFFYDPFMSYLSL